MNRFFCSLALLLFATFALIGQPTDYVAYWSFDNTADVQVGGSVISPTTTTNTFGEDRFGQAGNAIYFDGDDYLDYDPTPLAIEDLPYGDFSFSVWVKDDNVSGHHTILSAYTNNKGYILRTTYGDFDRRLNYYENHIKSQATSWDDIIPETWQHIAMTFNASTKEVKLYIDGSEVSYDLNNTGTGNYGGDGFRFQLGWHPGFDYMRGYLDDLYVFDRIINPDEILALADGGPDEDTSNGLVAHWPLSSDVLDVGTNELHGTTIGSTPSNGSYTLNGTSDYTDLSNPYELTNLPTEDLNLSFWLKGTNETGWHTVFSSYNNQGGWYLQSILEGEGRVFRTVIYFQGGNMNFHTTEPIPNDEWVHISFNYHAANQTGQYFVNGAAFGHEVISSGTTDTYKTEGSVSKYIGAHNFGPSSFFKGSLRDMYIYSRTLNEIEIQVLYGAFANAAGESFWQLADGGTDIFYDAGNVGIGTSDTRGYDLAVAGRTITTEVKVSHLENWPDFVFKENFELPTLEETEVFINQHAHLPNIPSEEEVAVSGIDLGVMNAKLLQKIEELTLHLIEINKRLKIVENEKNELKATLNRLESGLINEEK